MTDKHPGGHSALIVAYIIFGVNIPVMKSALSDGRITSVSLAFYRFAGAMFLFWIASLFVRKEKIPRKDLFFILLASLTGIFMNQYLFGLGLSMSSPIDAAVIGTFGPIFTMLLAALFLKEPITWKKAIGVFIGVAGAMLLIFSNNDTSRGNVSIIGDLLMLLSSLSFVIYLTAFKPLVSRYSPVNLMKWMFLFSTVCSLPFCWKDVMAVSYSETDLSLWIKIIYVVVFATFIAYLLLPVGQKLLRPTIVSMYNYMQPIVSSLLAVLFGMDIFGLRKTIATLLVFLGVYVVTQSKSRARLEAEKKKVL
jgi:drug/metabolite transporter (DMT)-like permease